MPPEHESPLQSLTATNVVIVAGKGGVGKTTVTAVIARAASRDGRRVLVVELDGKPTLDRLLGGEGQNGAGSVEVVHISAADALDEYLRDHGFARIAKRLNKTGVIDMVGTAAPGIDDVVVLGKGKSVRAIGELRLHRGRRSGRGSCDHLPHVCHRSGECGAERARASASRRSHRTAHRRRALPGRARHAARDDPGE